MCVVPIMAKILLMVLLILISPSVLSGLQTENDTEMGMELHNFAVEANNSFTTSITTTGIQTTTAVETVVVSLGDQDSKDVNLDSNKNESESSQTSEEHSRGILRESFPEANGNETTNGTVEEQEPFNWILLIEILAPTIIGIVLICVFIHCVWLNTKGNGSSYNIGSQMMHSQHGHEDVYHCHSRDTTLPQQRRVGEEEEEAAEMEMTETPRSSIHENESRDGGKDNAVFVASDAV